MLLDRKIPFIEGSGDKHINYLKNIHIEDCLKTETVPKKRYPPRLRG